MRRFIGPVEALFLVVVLVGFIVSPNFLTVFNIDSVLHQAAILGILAIGQFFVIVSGGFDLSVGALVALTTMVTASSLAQWGSGGVLIAIVVGLAMGALSGVAVTWARIPPFVATLGVMGVARGLAFTISNEGILIDDPTLLWLDNAGVGPVPLVAVLWLVLALLAWILMSKTRPGTYLYAVGGNEDTARLAGIPIGRIRMAAYVLSGGLAGIAGVLFAARSHSGSPGIASGWELDSIAAIVIGGVGLFGGSGHVLRAMLGVLVYLMLTNVMNLAGVDTYLQTVLKGLLILAAVSIPALVNARRRSA
ncbi:MAG: ABC transporter permease [Propionicimonas sp.]